MKYISIAVTFLQLSQYLEQKGEYGLNINTDVALWLDSRAFQKKPSLRQACGFVIINSELHDEFDQFRKKETHSDYSLLQHIKLLDLWLKSKMLHSLPNLGSNTSGCTTQKWIACVGGCWR